LISVNLGLYRALHVVKDLTGVMPSALPQGLKPRFPDGFNAGLKACSTPYIHFAEPSSWRPTALQKRPGPQNLKIETERQSLLALPSIS